MPKFQPIKTYASHKFVHFILLALGNDLGYPGKRKAINDEVGAAEDDYGHKLSLIDGFCAGVAISWLQASFIHDERSFTARIDFLIKFIKEGGEFSAFTDAKQKVITKKPLTADEIQLLDILAWFDTLMLHQQPFEFKEVFSKEMYQSNIIEISRFTQSKAAEGSTLIELYTDANIYSLEQLKQYLEAFPLAAAKLAPPLKDTRLGFLLKSMAHAVAITFDTTTKQFSFMDINQYPPKQVTNTDELISLIRSSETFGSREFPEMTTFHTTLFALENPQNKEQLALLKDILSKSISKEINPQNLSRINSPALSLLVLVKFAEFNRLAFDSNAAHLWGRTIELLNDHLTTPVHFAALKGFTNIIEEIIKLPNARKLLNKRDSKGYTPAFLAASEGNIEIIKALAKLPYAHELFTVESDGSTPAFAAAYFNHAAVIQTLSELSFATELMTHLCKGFSVAYLATSPERDPVFQAMTTSKSCYSWFQTPCKDGRKPSHFLTPEQAKKIEPR
jgi:hypothetical protein